jgi:hypothetical protein
LHPGYFQPSLRDWFVSQISPQDSPRISCTLL